MKKEFQWACNECGAAEYTMSVSEEDIQHFSCSNCGGDEWHKEIIADLVKINSDRERA